MSNRKDRREQERQSRKQADVGAGSSYTAAFGPAMPTAVADFIQGTQFPHGFMVVDPTGDGAPIMPLPIILLDQKCMQQAVGLQRLSTSIAVSEPSRSTSRWWASTAGHSRVTRCPRTRAC